MRLVNDNQEANEVKAVDIFAVISQMFLVSVGIASWFFSPLVMVLSHCRFPNPWSKVAGLGGALLALLFLEVPLAQAIISFVVGIYVADSISRDVPPLALLIRSLAVALTVALALVCWAAVQEHQAVGAYWHSWVSDWVERLKSSSALQGSVNWEVVREMVLMEGPFLYLSASLVSIWIAIGLGAHFEWFTEGSGRYTSRALKGLRLPGWVNFIFMLSLMGALWSGFRYQSLVAGLFRILSGLMFVQGSVCLSELMAQRGIRRNIRTLIYCVGILLGFYALVGMGMMSPWILRKRGRISPQILPHHVEEKV